MKKRIIYDPSRNAWLGHASFSLRGRKYETAFLDVKAWRARLTLSKVKAVAKTTIRRPRSK